MSFQAALIVSFLFFVVACGDAVVGQDGVFYPAVDGDYTVESSTGACLTSFGTGVTVTQSAAVVTVRPTTATLSSFTGAVDAHGVLALTGVEVTLGEAFACAGGFVDGFISLSCVSDSVVCTITLERT